VAEVHGELPPRDRFVPQSNPCAGRWLLLPPASGNECVGALKRAGFRLRLQEGDQALLVKGYRVVCVPLVERIAAEELVMILQSAGVSVADFTEYLDD
jgi:hypothetical protein